MSKTCPVCGTTYADGDAFCPKDGTTLRGDDSLADIVGMVIADRYLVQELLGEGGMGRVYLARHVRLPQQAAIKVLHPGMVSDAAAVARFNREAANAARIEHDRVARVFDFGETREGLVYIAMEYVPGRTLRALLNVEMRLPVGRAANIVFQIAEGLDAAHRIGIVHRDLKPDNIIVVTDEQGSDRCKVVDFGIAKAVDSRETQLTQAGMLVGTPEFMSPEQVLGEPLDARSDVYALALVAFVAFTGTLPFPAGSAERSLAARLIDDPRTLASAAPDVPWPDELQRAFDGALQREPADRTGTALEFGDAIVRAVEYWTGISVLRPRTPMSTAALTGAASAATSARLTRPALSPTIVDGAHALTAAVDPAEDQRIATAALAPAPAAPRPSRASGRLAALAVGLVLVAGAGYAAMNSGAGDGALRSANASPDAADSSASTVVPVAAAKRASVSGAASRPGAEAAGAPSSLPAGVPIVGVSAEGDSAAAVTTVSTVAPQPPAAENDAGRSADAAVARREMQSITVSLEQADDDDVAAARIAIPRLNALLPRFTEASDSTWAYIHIASAHGLAGDDAGVCASLQRANRLGKTPQQLKMIRVLMETGNLTCKL